MASYRQRIAEDVRRWVGEGLIDEATGQKMLRDVDARASRAIGLGGILAMLAALLFAAAVLVFIAADWDAIPRELRVAGLVALIVGLLAGGFALKRRGQHGFGEAVWLAAAACFGAAILLIGQMYDVSGNEDTAILVWCIGTAAAAAALPSAPLATAAAGLATAWLFAEAADAWGDAPFPYVYPALCGLVWLASLRPGAPAARNVLLLSLTAYAVLLAAEHDLVAVGSAMAAVAALLFVVAARQPNGIERVLKLAGHAPVQFLLAALLGLAMIQLQLMESAGFVLSVAAALAAIAGALVVGGRSSRGVRRLCYLAFAAEIGIVLLVTMGTMLDTAAFFLVSAALLALAAFVIARVENRLAARPSPAA